MGQRSTFMLERQGTFQHWKNIWDSKESFQKTNFELLLLKDCMSVFFSNKNYLNWRFFNFRNKKYLSKRFGIKTSSRDLEKYLVEKKKVKKSTAFVISCFAFKYHGWLFFFIQYFLKKKFVTNKVNFRKLKNKKKRKIKNKKFNHLFYRTKSKVLNFDFSYNFF